MGVVVFQQLGPTPGGWSRARLGGFSEQRARTCCVTKWEGATGGAMWRGKAREFTERAFRRGSQDKSFPKCLFISPGAITVKVMAGQA
jgi:hypothetical protein